MTDVAAIVFSGAAVVLAGICSHAFHSSLRQRDRTLLSATDKAELLTRLDDVDGRIRELKNTLPPRRT